MALDPWYVGEPLSADELNTYAPLGVVAQGNRGSNKTGITALVGYLRIDGVPLVTGRAYMVLAQNLRVGISGTTPGTTDHFKMTVTYDGTGAAAGTGSTEIGRSEFSPIAAGTADDSLSPITGWVLPSADATGSFLLTAQRTAGVATYDVQADTGGIWLTVVDMGYAVADAGVDI
jgi:hypothetical protein